MSAKQITKTKIYTITVHEFSDGSSSLTRHSDGFTAFEMLGIFNHLANMQKTVLANEAVKSIKEKGAKK